MGDTLFVAGGAGFIASNFIRYWLNKYPNDNIINYDLLTYAGNLENLSDIVQNFPDRYKFRRGDIEDYDFCHYLFLLYKPNYVINFAAQTHNSLAIIYPHEFFQTNVMGTQVLIQACLDAKILRFHHISTCEVYGDLPLDSKEKFTEESPYRPRTPYNVSKAGSDMAVRCYYETFGLPMTISNCCNNYGTHQYPEKLIPNFITKLINKEKIPLYQSSQNKREWLHVLDHCKAIDLILKYGEIGQTYNVGSGLELSIEEIADLLLEIFGLNNSYKEYVPDRPAHDRRYLLDSSKIQRELNWYPEIEFAKGFRDTVEWYKNNQAWWQPLLKKLEINETEWKK